jgi:hypothetical protein
MNRIGVAVVAGGLLGILDGLSAWFTPEVRAQLLGIVVGSTIKGVLAGVLIGLFARKVGQMGWTLAFGTFIGALLAFGVASMQGAHYLAIILPGSLVGLLTGFATVRYGRAPATVSSAAR